MCKVEYSKVGLFRAPHKTGPLLISPNFSPNNLFYMHLGSTNKTRICLYKGGLIKQNFTV